ncbi:MAG: pyrroloquinoline quinone biosynthesis protein PqqB [Acetobacteraceae bacterium]|nr:pyrroloquinoline quinone biosynthesis protein PqqB [Acetobacteraceae bacterium]
MKAIVLGSAAGGGVPQWNCGCRICDLARRGDPRVRPATQVGLAVSANGSDWLLVGASPDLRQQILQTPALWPRRCGRHSPIVGVVLTGSDIDALAGLLVLRESQPFAIYAPPSVIDVLNSNHIFNVLDRRLVEHVAILPDAPISPLPGLRLTLLALPGKTPLYLEDRTAAQPEAGPAYAARIEADGRAIVMAPACARITDDMLARLRDADVVFFDGTLYQDDEMIVAGLGQKTGRRMGHVSLSGPDGTLAHLRDLPARRILLHINNTNPILLSSSPERAETEQAGFEIAYDGMEITL